MAAKIAIVCLIALVMFQVLTWQTEASVVRRDAPAKNASQTVEEAFESLKAGLDDMVKNVQNNELYQNATNKLREFAKVLETEGQQLVDKIKTGKL